MRKDWSPQAPRLAAVLAVCLVSLSDPRAAQAAKYDIGDLVNEAFLSWRVKDWANTANIAPGVSLWLTVDSTNTLKIRGSAPRKKKERLAASLRSVVPWLSQQGDKQIIVPPRQPPQKRYTHATNAALIVGLRHWLEAVGVPAEAPVRVYVRKGDLVVKGDITREQRQAFLQRLPSWARAGIIRRSPVRTKSLYVRERQPRARRKSRYGL